MVWTLGGLMEWVGPDRRELFEALFVRYHGYVAAYALRLAPPALVDDVVGETFLVLWRSLDRVPDDPLPWLYGVARRVLANDRRGRRRRAALVERLRQERRSQAPGAGFDLVVSGPLRDALLALSSNEREAVLLIAWEGLSPAQAASAAGCSATAFRVRLHRAEIATNRRPIRAPATLALPRKNSCADAVVTATFSRSTDPVVPSRARASTDGRSRRVAEVSRDIPHVLDGPRTFGSAAPASANFRPTTASDQVRPCRFARPRHR